MTPGTKIVCVDDSIRPEMAEWQRKFCPNWVKKGETYTVREFDDNDGIVDGVLLEEVRNKPVYLTKWDRVIEPRFATWRFREMSPSEPNEIQCSEKETETAFL